MPTDDGRSLWIAEQVQTSSAAKVPNVAFEPDVRAPFGTDDYWSRLVWAAVP